MRLKSEKIVELLDNSGYDAYVVKSNDPASKDDKIVITGSRFSLSVHPSGFYVGLYESRDDLYGQSDPETISHGSAATMANLRTLLSAHDFSLK